MLEYETKHPETFSNESGMSQETDFLHYAELKQYLDKVNWDVSLADTFSDALWATDLNFKTIYISPAIHALTGETPSEHLKRNLAERYPPASEEQLRRMYQEEILEEAKPDCNHKRSRITEVELYKKDSSTVWVSLNMSFIRNADGKPIGIKGLTRDISKQKEIEIALNQTRQTYLDILNTISEAIYVQDTNGTFIDVNEGATRMYSCTREDLIGKNPFDVAAPGMNDMDLLLKNSQEVLQHGCTRSFEFWAVKKTGEVFPKEVILNRGMYFNQEVIIATARDISQRKEAEEKLIESEELYRKLLLTVPDLIIRCDMQGIIQYVNELALLAFSIDSAAEVIGRNIFSFIAPEDMSRAIENTKLMFEKKLGLQEYRIVSNTGEVFDCEVNGDVVFDAHNQPIGMVYVLRNISQRKQTEMELSKNQELMQLILENIPQFVFWKDRESRFLGCNNNFARISGFDSVAEVIGKTDYDMTWKKEEADFFVECDRKVMASGVPQYHIIEPQTRKDGRLTWLDTNKIPLFDYEGKVIGILGTYQDITEQREAEEKLKMQTKLRQLLVEISSAYINLPIEEVEKETDGSMIKLSEFVGADRCYIFTYDHQTHLCSITQEWCAEGIEPLRADLQNIILHPNWVNSFQQGKPYYIPDVSELTEDDAKQTLEARHVVTLISIPMMHNGICIGFVGFDSICGKHSYSETEQQLLQVFTQMLVNIQLRKHSEEELIKAKEKAEESDRLKMAFLANMSHEIRTPMNGILGFAGLLKEANLTGEQRLEYISLIEKSGIRMLNVINDIISISKIEAGLMTVVKKEIVVNEQVEFIYAFFKHEVLAKGMKLSFHNTLPATEARVNTDPEKLYAILSNLVKNAVKYSNEGFIQIGYERKGNVLEFYVKDTGIGIPANKQEAIFERFIQADDTASRAYEGAGLGLSIAKAYVEMLNGKIWVESTEGVGSTFYFTIPYETDYPVSEDFEIQDSALSPERYLPRLNVLIAEDEEISFRLLHKFISNFCSNIIRAKTGFEAVKMHEANSELNLILMDVKMPDMDGYQATRKIREIDKEIIIIAQTAYGLTGDLELAMSCGCNDYIAKPINREELIAMLIKHFRKNHTQEKPNQPTD